MDYNPKTQELIDRMCRYVERKSFVLDKKVVEEKLMQTYDLFDLPRPKKVVWVKSPFDTKFTKSAESAWSARSAGSAWSARSAGSAGSAESAWSAWSAGSAGSAWSARSAGSAGSAESAWSARSAGSAWSARSAGSAWSARSAGSAGSARSAGSAGSAWSASDIYMSWTGLDDDFYYFTFNYEYVLNPDKDLAPNENDTKYLQYSELLLEALEAGCGYRVEWEDTLYIAPCPIVRLNEDTPPIFHSDQLPAIKWENIEFYYLDGVSLKKDLWKKIVSQKMTFKEIMAIEISDQRTVALKYNPEAILKENSKLVHKDNRNNELYLIEGQQLNKDLEFPKIYFLKMLCPTGRVFIEGVPPNEAEKNPNATDMQALLCGLTKSEYYSMKLES